MAENKTNIRISGDVSGLTAAVESAKRSIGSLGGTAERVGKTTQQASRIAAESYAKFGENANKAGVAAEFTSKKQERAAKSLENAIQRTIAAEAAGSRATREYYELLANQRGLDIKRFDPLLQKLDALNNKVKANTISIGQYQNALRMAPAQFTDIVTQLAGGQSPFLIAIQQGGQLRDSFGSFGMMFKGLASFITPTTVALGGAAAAVTAVGAAFIQGSKESDFFRKAVILAGGSSSVTAGQIQMMAAKIGDSTGAISEAREALTSLISTGAAVSETFEQVATAIAYNSEMTGQKVEELVKQFAKVKEEPVKAVVELSQNYDTLTVAVYEQAKALTEAGRKGDAVILVQNKLAQGVVEAGRRTWESAGLMEKGWLTVKKAAEMAWDAMKGIGREDPLEKQLQSVLQQIAKLEAQKKGDSFFGTAYDDDIAKLKKEAVEIQRKIKSDSDAQKARQQQAEAVAKRAEMDKQADSVIKANQTPVERIDEQIKQARELEKYYRSIKDDKIAANKADQIALDIGRMQKDRAEAVKKANEKGKPKGRYQINSAVRTQAQKYNYAGLEKTYGLPRGLLAAISMQESRGNVNALSPRGARGLFQFMPDTAKAYGVNVRDPESSARGAAKYLSESMKRFNGDLFKVISSYNAGPGKIANLGKVYKDKFGQIRVVTLSAETKKYTPKVMHYMANYNNQADDGSADAARDYLREYEEIAKKRLDIVKQFYTGREKLDAEYQERLEKIDEAGFDADTRQKYLELAKQDYNRDVAAYEEAQRRKLESAWDFTKDAIQLIHERAEAERKEIELNKELTQSQKDELLNASKAHEKSDVLAYLGIDEVNQAVQQLKMLQRELGMGNLSAHRYKSMFDNIGINRSFKEAKKWGKQEAPFDDLKEQYENYQESITNFYDVQIELAQGNADKIVEIERKKQEDLASLNETYQQQSLTAQLGYGEQIVGSMSSMLEESVGKHSAAYRLMFATQKAFAIASSVIAIQNAIAQASAAPFPSNLAAMATVAAETANIVSSIAAVSAGFSSGGYTGDGGKYEPAGIVHRGEFVLNQTDVRNMGGVAGIERLRALAGGNSRGYADGGAVGRSVISNMTANPAIAMGGVHQTITVNGNPDNATMQAIENAAKRGAQMGYQQVARHLATGQGDVSKALKGGWTTSRKLS
jgi:phage-related minor tail protein